MSAFVLFLIGLLIYFIPAGVAGTRKHPNAGAITLLNLFLGWTLVGWVVALVWASMAIPEPAPAVAAAAPSAPIDAGDTKKCPLCAETIKREAIRCRFCGADLQQSSSPASPAP